MSQRYCAHMRNYTSPLSCRWSYAFGLTRSGGAHNRSLLHNVQTRMRRRVVIRHSSCDREGMMRASRAVVPPPRFNPELECRKALLCEAKRDGGTEFCDAGPLGEPPKAPTAAGNPEPPAQKPTPAYHQPVTRELQPPCNLTCRSTISNM